MPIHYSQHNTSEDNEKIDTLLKHVDGITQRNDTATLEERKANEHLVDALLGAAQLSQRGKDGLTGFDRANRVSATLNSGLSFVERRNEEKEGNQSGQSR